MCDCPLFKISDSIPKNLAGYHFEFLGDAISVVGNSNGARFGNVFETESQLHAPSIEVQYSKSSARFMRDSENGNLEQVSSIYQNCVNAIENSQKPVIVLLNPIQLDLQ